MNDTPSDFSAYAKILTAVKKYAPGIVLGTGVGFGIGYFFKEAAIALVSTAPVLGEALPTIVTPLGPVFPTILLPLGVGLAGGAATKLVVTALTTKNDWKTANPGWALKAAKSGALQGAILVPLGWLVGSFFAPHVAPPTTPPEPIVTHPIDMQPLAPQETLPPVNDSVQLPLGNSSGCSGPNCECGPSSAEPSYGGSSSGGGGSPTPGPTTAVPTTVPTVVPTTTPPLPVPEFPVREIMSSLSRFIPQFMAPLFH